jgi:hypothetical protein
MFEIAGTDPYLQAALPAGFDTFRRDISGAVARRLGRQAGEEVPSLVAGMAFAAVHSALERWSAQGAGGESLVPYPGAGSRGPARRTGLDAAGDTG